MILSKPWSSTRVPAPTSWAKPKRPIPPVALPQVMCVPACQI